MTARERLNRYFNLVRRQSQLSTDEWHEMIHLEEALVEDIIELERLQKEKHD